MDNCTIYRSVDNVILTIYIETYTLKYTITTDTITFEMDDITIDYIKKYDWTINDLRCKSLTVSHGLLTILGNVRMICTYNIDIAYRLFLETVERAVEISREMTISPDIPKCTSELIKTSMTPDCVISRNASPFQFPIIRASASMDNISDNLNFSRYYP